MAGNLFDQLDEIARRGRAGAVGGARALPAGGALRPDAGAAGARLAGGRRGARRRSSGSRREPWVESRRPRRTSRSGVRLADDWIEATGAALDAGGDGDAPHADLAAGRRFALNFWDANSTKALHIGHLRNLALGNALGAALTEAGGKVERRSIICDVGRSMGEAMAGVVKSGRHTQASLESGEKSDHFVGACYAEYVKSGPSRTARRRRPGRDSLDPRVDVHDDSADELMQRVLDGDQEAIELWSKTRAWVISGQRKTLARLGIAFDRVFFESDFLPEVAELIEPRPRATGMLQRRADGVVDLPDRARGAGGDAAGARRRPADPAHAGARLLDGGARTRRRRPRSRSAAPSGSPTSPAAAS